MTSSKSRSRPTGCCWSPTARWKHSRLKREVKELKQLTPIATALVGKSPAMNQLRQTIEKVAPTNSRILIVGPSGAGKELCARTLHRPVEPRRSGPFVVINAAAITPERMETELFGVEQTNGTQSRKVGALEEAHGGTLFIDEIADMPRETQNKILRVLADQTFERVGGSGKVAVDVRIVSSTSRNLEAEIAAGTFPRGPVITGCRSCRSACRRSPSGARTSRCWSTISWTRFRLRPACPSAPSAKTPWRCCNRMTGRAMSASFATTSSG